MAKTILGVDIGYDNLKLALVSGIQVLQTVSVPMPRNLVRDGNIVSGESMGELIRTTMKENGIRANAAALVLSNEAVFVKNVTMPQMTADQLVYNLPFEFRDFITGEIRDYVFDYAMITDLSKIPRNKDAGKKAAKEKQKGGLRLGGRRRGKADGDTGFTKDRMDNAGYGMGGTPGFSSTGASGGYSGYGGGTAANAGFDSSSGFGGGASGFDAPGENEEATPPMELLAVSAPKSYMEENRAILRRAGMKLVKAAPAICAYIQLIRTYEEETETREGEYCILDLGYQGIRMHMFRDDRYEVTRDLDSGLSMLDEVLSEVYGIDIHLAHTYLMSNYENCQRREECLEAYDRIAMELMRVLNFYRYSNPDSNINTVWLCGGGAVIAPLREALADMLDLEVRPASMLVPGGSSIEDCNSFLQAIGITMG